MTEKIEETSFNRLKYEKSLFLKLHADDPVHWWAFGPLPLQKAQDENKPIFMSIGHSSCHLCHLMRDESFIDQNVADYLNQNYICIKIDREELPDIDTFYQHACQIFSKSAGWPLSVFMLPDMRPYFVGTYFSSVSSKEKLSFYDLICDLKRAFDSDKDLVEKNATQVLQKIKEGLVPQDKVEFEGHFPHPMAIIDAVKQFEDVENGGYGGAPKFPNFFFYEWILEQILEGMIPKENATNIIAGIEKMFMGGIHDHARGGFHRCTTDKKWMAPNFEKLLYDQAGLIKILSKLSFFLPNPLIFDSLINTMEYLEHEMLGDENYFFSGQNADSEGVEGLYFTFTKREFLDTLKKHDDPEQTLEKNIENILKWFRITEEGNFRQKLNLISLDYQHKSEFFKKENWTIVRLVKRAILEERKQRIPPQTDTKGVASWNFMVLTALMDVMQYCPLESIKQSAMGIFNKALNGVFSTFIISDISKNSEDSEEEVFIQHSTTRKNNFPYFEDYVFFAELQLRIFEITGNKAFKDHLYRLIQFINKEFIDLENGIALTRNILANDSELYPNQEVSSFDTTIRSPIATYIGIVRRSEALFNEPDLITPLEKVKEKMTHEVLKNPIHSGEALRALSYPDEAYRKIKVPVSWPTNPKFVNFILYFLPRFVLSYHEENNETWEICNINEPELQGEGLDNFVATLTPGKG